MSIARREMALLGAIPVVFAGAITLWSVNPGSESDARPWHHNSQMISKAEDVVKGRLKDPESADFRNVSVAQDGLTVCGEVNAKNSFGGYVGYRPFLTVGDYVDIAKDGRLETAQRYTAACTEPAPPPTNKS
jgi:hypothetical protein